MFSKRYTLLSRCLHKYKICVKKTQSDDICTHENCGKHIIETLETKQEQYRYRWCDGKITYP